MFLEFVLAFSWHEPKIAIMPQSSDAPNMMPVPNNPTAPATAAAIGSARLVRSFFLKPRTLQKRGYLSFYFVQVFVSK